MSDLGVMAKFLEQGGTWKGTFANFYNRNDGIIQHGNIIVEITIDDNGIIRQRNAILKPDGTPGPYEGAAVMKVEKNRLICPEPWTKDPHTGNEYECYQYDGYIGKDHIYILESYYEIFSNGKKQHRRNSVHYYFRNDSEIYMIADVYVDEKLLVFASTRLIENSSSVSSIKD
jgi:hypothetical protein